MRTAILSPVSHPANQSEALPLAAEPWADRLAAIGLPQRYTLRLYVFLRMTFGGTRFEDLAPGALCAGMLFDVRGPIAGIPAASAGDQLMVTPLERGRELVLLQQGAGRTVRRRIDAPALLATLPALESSGVIRFARCFTAGAGGAQ